MENLFDFTNYREHPTQKEYQVFHFVRKDQANFFENLLDNLMAILSVKVSTETRRAR